MSSDHKLQKIHTFADDVTAARNSNTPSSTTATEATPAPAEPNSEPTKAHIAAQPKNDSTPRVPTPQPPTSTRQAVEFLQLKTSLAKSVSSPPTTTQPTPKTKSETPAPATVTSTAKPPTTLKASLAQDIENQTQTTPEVDLASLDSDTAFETGTIVRDKKQKKFHLWEAIRAGLAGTFKKLTTRKKVSKPQVTTAESRKDVITQAARNSYNAAANDFRTIKNTSQNIDEAATPNTPVQIKDVDKTPQASWSHFVNKEESAETNTPVSEPTISESAAPVVSETISDSQQTVPATPTPQQSSVATTTPEIPETPDQSKEPDVVSKIASSDLNSTPAPKATPAETADTTGAITEVPVAEPPVMTTPRETSDSSETTPAPQNTTAAEALPSTFKDPAQSAPSRWSQYVSRFAIVFVIIGAVGLGASTAFFWFGNFSGESPDRLVSVPSLIPTNQQVAITLGEDRLSLLTRFNENTNRATALTQLYPVYDINAEPLVPVNTTDIFQTTAFRMPGNLVRSINSATFGSTATQEPFLIFRVQDFDTAFAGMLTWEAAMSADLEPWFGTTVTQTFDSTARTSTQLRPAFFIDRIQDNSTIRVLIDAEQTDRITYGFVTPQIVLITTSPKIYRTLKNTIQNR